MELTFEAHVAERDYSVAFDLPPGQTLAIVGPNGAGKSTTVDIIAGLLEPDTGHVRLAGNVLFRREGDSGAEWVPSHRRRVGLVPQQSLLFPHLTAQNNVAFGPRSRGASRQSARELAERWMAEVGVQDLASRRPSSLSGGQAQRVALARALATEPRILLLDEPLASVDAVAIPELRELLGRVLRERSAILVTHDAQDALALAHRVLVLEKGRVAQTGLTREVFSNPATDFVRSLTFGLRD